MRKMQNSLRSSDDKIVIKDSCDSLGTKRLPERATPANDYGGQLQQQPSTSSCQSAETIYAHGLSDVSFFDDSDSVAAGGGTESTLAIIKPEAARLMYKIESVMERNGFIIKTKDVLRLTREQAAEFYNEHSLKLYFHRLIEHMSSGPVVVYVLTKKNCVDEWQRLIGPADVSFAKQYFPVSLRAVYGTEPGTDPVANAFHGSDSPDAAKREIQFFFPNSETEDTDDALRYVQSVMMPTINEGLSEMFEANPNDPLRWFGNWLLTRSVI